MQNYQKNNTFDTISIASMALIKRQTEISAQVVAFAGFLRTKGFSISPAREADALRGLLMANITQQTHLYLVLRAVFPLNVKQLKIFDNLFETYWKELEKAVDSKIKDQEKESEKKKKKQPKSPEEAFEALKNWLNNNRANEKEDELAAYSLGESLLEKDFSSYLEDDLTEAQQVIGQLVKKIRRVQSRRYVPTHKGASLDLRHTLRDNFRRGDEVVNLFYHKPKRNKIRLVLLCDVSKSMDLYSRFFVQFMFTFQNLYDSIETFVFSTKLCRITEDLKEMKYEQALENLRENVRNWSGGTDLGVVFREFVQEYAFRKLNSRTIVLIVSDGLDTAESNDLGESMASIKRKARRVFWLNPLASMPNYRPETKGLKAALPHLDALLPAHNLESLKQVIDKIK